MARTVRIKIEEDSTAIVELEQEIIDLGKVVEASAGQQGAALESLADAVDAVAEAEGQLPTEFPDELFRADKAAEQLTKKLGDVAIGALGLEGPFGQVASGLGKIGFDQAGKAIGTLVAGEATLATATTALSASITTASTALTALAASPVVAGAALAALGYEAYQLVTTLTELINVEADAAEAISAGAEPTTRQIEQMQALAEATGMTVGELQEITYDGATGLGAIFAIAKENPTGQFAAALRDLSAATVAETRAAEDQAAALAASAEQMDAVRNEAMLVDAAIGAVHEEVASTTPELDAMAAEFEKLALAAAEPGAAVGGINSELKAHRDALKAAREESADFGDGIVAGATEAQASLESIMASIGQVTAQMDLLTGTGGEVSDELARELKGQLLDTGLNATAQSSLTGATALVDAGDVAGINKLSALLAAQADFIERTTGKGEDFLVASQMLESIGAQIKAEQEAARAAAERAAAQPPPLNAAEMAEAVAQGIAKSGGFGVVINLDGQEIAAAVTAFGNRNDTSKAF